MVADPFRATNPSVKRTIPRPTNARTRQCCGMKVLGCNPARTHDLDSQVVDSEAVLELGPPMHTSSVQTD